MATETEKSPPEQYPKIRWDRAAVERVEAAMRHFPWDTEAQADRRNVRLTLQAERAAQEIERREMPRWSNWRRIIGR